MGQYLETFLVVTTRGVTTPGIQRTEAKDAAESPRVHRTATTKNHLAPVSTARRLSLVLTL